MANHRIIEEDDILITLGTTPKGKTIEAVLKNHTRLYSIRFREGGELPKTLRGMFTSSIDAQKAATAYLESLKVKTTESNGSTKSLSTKADRG